jgi:ribosomal protein S30
MSGGSKRTYGNAFNTPHPTPNTPKIENKKKKKYAPHDVLQKVFNNKRRVQQLIMNYKSNGRLNENETVNMFSGSINLQKMYNSLTINQRKSVINSIRIQVRRLSNK